MAELVRAAGLSGYVDLAAECGLDAANALRRAGLSVAALRDPNALISYRSVIRLLEHSARETGLTDFGLRLSERQGLDILGSVAVVMQHARTLAAALALGSRYVFVHSPSIRFALEPAPDSPGFTDLRFGIEIANVPARDQAIELSLGVIVRIVRLLGQGRIRPALVLMPHAPLSSSRVYAQHLACACRFEAPYAAVRVRSAELSQPLASHNPMLSELARSFLDSHHVQRDRPMAGRVTFALREFIGTNRTGQDDIARMLALHPRTMHRRLQGEGTTFERIKDEVRRERFQELLQRSTVPPLSQIALMLDYSAQSALTRSCRRWFGKAPSALGARTPSPSRSPATLRRTA
jgi:AraC-like DNA-binding protein